ncbi:MAG: hypothetical protein REI45_09455, partial [Propionicimonas sp.]|nr:hypothetical protein [Propionicimonas sp.]
MKRIFLPAVLVALALAGCTAPVAANPTSPAPATTAAAGSVSCEYAVTGGAARQVQPPAADGVPGTGTAEAVMTLKGTEVTLTLDREAAPCTVNSFV